MLNWSLLAYFPTANLTAFNTTMMSCTKHNILYNTSIWCMWNAEIKSPLISILCVNIPNYWQFKSIILKKENSLKHHMADFGLPVNHTEWNKSQKISNCKLQGRLQMPFQILRFDGAYTILANNADNNIASKLTVSLKC